MMEGNRAAACALLEHGRENLTFTDLLHSVQGDMPACRSAYQMATSAMPSALMPPTGPGSLNQSLSSNHSAACIPRLTFTPELIPTNLLCSNHRHKGSLPPAIQPLLLPTSSRYLTKVDVDHVWRFTGQNAQGDQLTESTASSSSSSVALTPSEEGGTSGVSFFEVNKHDHVVALQEEDNYVKYSNDMEQLAMDLDYDTYDDLMFEDAYTDEDPDELFDYRLDYTAAEVTRQPQLKDLESEELEVPAWFTNQVRSTEKTLCLKLSSPVQPQTGTVYEDCNEILTKAEGKEMQELATVDVYEHTKGSEGGCNELVRGYTDSNCGDERAQIEHEASTQHPKLNIDLERALKLFKDSEAVQESFKALYNFTEASTERGCFFPPNALETVVAKQEKEIEIVHSVAPALLSPKPEPEELDFPNPSRLHGPMVQVKEVPQDVSDTSRLLSWIDLNQSSLNGDVESNWKVRTSLKTLEQVWLKISKDQRKDPNQPSEEKLRPDLMHMRIASRFRRDGLWLNDKNRPIGNCPGVPVGACFNYRIEMALIGLHRAFQSGIAVVPADLSPYKKPVASSVVLITSKGDPYKDDKDMGDTVIYSGHGGLISGKTDEYQDQKLERGNLALANSFELGVPIRLIRGHRLQDSRTGRLYSYDGLYKVAGFKYEIGVHGNKVYLFTMVRLPGQAPRKIPTMAALLYKGEADTDSYLSQIQKSRNRKFRTPSSQAKSSASISKSAIEKPGSASKGVEFAVLPSGWDNADKACMSVLYSKTAPCKSQ